MSKLIVLGEVESTHDEARRLAAEGAPSGTAIVARSQREGRGRLGRSWHSPDAGNLYLSLIHRSARAAHDLQGISLDAACAVADVLETAGLSVGIKWPNDLMVDGRKVGGILSELVMEGDQATVLIGVGINVNASVDDFSAELLDIATSVAMETGEETDLVWLGKRVASTLSTKLAAFEVRGGPDLRAYTLRDTLAGARVEYEGQGGRREGVVEGIDSKGALRILDAQDGVSVSVTSGEIHRLAAGAHT